MFIKRCQHPDIEFNPADGQSEPTLVHYFSNRGDPFRSVLPQLAGAEDEQVLVVQSPLSELVDWMIKLHAHDTVQGRAVVDQQHRALFEAVKASLAQVTAKLDQVEFAVLEDKEESDD